MHKLKYFFLLGFISFSLNLKAVNVSISNVSYTYNAATGIISNLKFTLNNNEMQGTPGYDINIYATNTSTMNNILIKTDPGNGGIGGNGSQDFNYSNIDLNNTSGMVSGNYRLILIVPQFSSNPYLLDNQTLEFTKKTSSITESNGPELNIYPNPVSDRLYISNSPKFFTWEIYNATGSLLLNKSDSNESIDISGLKPGMYICVLKGDGIFDQRKILKL